jgi:CRISPR-associated endonuclease Cas3-HD
MRIYSFVGETLAEHSYLTLRLYLSAFGERHERVLACKVASEGIEREEIKRAMRIACLLHDTGKSCNEFQERLREFVRGNNNRKHPGFPCHEVLSAYFTYETLIRL